MRCIYYSNETGTIEGVFFTEDAEMDAVDVLPYGCKVIADFDTDDGFPSSFPLEYNLEKS